MTLFNNRLYSFIDGNSLWADEKLKAIVIYIWQINPWE